jgi:hypothetical protein
MATVTAQDQQWSTRRRTGDLAPADLEAALEAALARDAEPGVAGGTGRIEDRAGAALRRLHRRLEVGRAAARLRWLAVRPSRTPSGWVLWEEAADGVSRLTPAPWSWQGPGWPVIWLPGAAVLEIPATRADYLAGRHRQAVRTNLNRSAERGELARELTDPSEQLRALSSVMLRDERPWATAALEVVRRRAAHGAVRVFAAAGPDGDDRAVSAVIVHAPYAYLALACSVEGEGSYARYALHVHIVESLMTAGVRRLLVGPSGALLAGQRYFQRLLGFELANLVVSRPGPAGAPAEWLLGAAARWPARSLRAIATQPSHAARSGRAEVV